MATITAHSGDGGHEILGGPAGNVARMVDRLSRVDVATRLMSAAPPEPRKIMSQSRAHVLYEYAAAQDDELSLAVGDIIELLEENEVEDGWMRGRLANGRVGVFPSNFVEVKRATNISPPPAKPQPVKADPVKPIQVKEIDKTSPTDISSCDRLPEAIQRRQSGSIGSVGHPETSATQTSKPSTGAATGDVKSKVNRLNNPPAVPAQPVLVSAAAAAPKKEQKFKEMARVLFTYTPNHADELELSEVGAMVTITKKDTGDPGWFEGEINGKRGLFPDNFVEIVQVPIEETSATIGHKAPNEKPPLEKPGPKLAGAVGPLLPPQLPAKPPKPALNGSTTSLGSGASAGVTATSAAPAPVPMKKTTNPAFAQAYQNIATGLLAKTPKQVEEERRAKSIGEPLGPSVDKNDNEEPSVDMTASADSTGSSLTHLNKARAPRPSGTRPKSMFPRTNIDGSSENLLDGGNNGSLDGGVAGLSQPLGPATMSSSLHAKSLSGGTVVASSGAVQPSAAAAPISKPSVVTANLNKDRELPNANVPRSSVSATSHSSSVDSPWVSRKEFADLLARLEAVEAENAELRKRIAKLEQHQRR